MTSKNLADEALDYDRVFHASFSAARKARDRLVTVRPHRAITPLKVTPWLLSQALVLPLVLCALLLWCKPALMTLWRSCIMFWAGVLDIPFTAASGVDSLRIYQMSLGGWPAGTPMPGAVNLGVTAAVSMAGLLMSGAMKNASLPLKYPLRIVCLVQLASVAYFWLAPSYFPYSIGHHSEELMTMGYVVMLATPLMLGMGYYILNQKLWIKLAHTALILGFMVVLVPHQVMAQAYLLTHLSVLFMPVLYVCFGAVFDALVFVALYSWAASQAPMDATR